MRSLHALTSLTLVISGSVICSTAASCTTDEPGRDSTSEDAPAPTSFVVDADGALVLQVARDVVRVRTRAVERGGTAATGAVERFTARGDGAEQTWTFERKPAGDGDLIVRVGVDDLTFVGTSACGAQYRSESTGNGICYGRATWVDARGVRSEVPWSIDRNGIAMRVPDEVLEASVYPAVLDPIIGPEIEVGDFAWGPTRRDERFVAAAAGNGGALVAWPALGPLGLAEALPEALQARRIGVGGLPDGPVIEVLEGEFVPTVAFDGSVFRIFAYTAAGEARLVRLTPEGAVLDPGGIALPGGTWSHRAACAPDGSCLLLRPDELLPVGADGTVGPPMPAGGASPTGIVRGDSEYWLALSSPTGVFVASIDDGSDTPSAAVQLASDPDGKAEIAIRDDGGILVTWCSAAGLRWAVLDDTLARIAPDGLVDGWCGANAVPTSRGFAAATPDGRLIEIDLGGEAPREAALPITSEFIPEPWEIASVGVDGGATWLWVDVAMDLLMDDPFVEIQAAAVDLDAVVVGAPELVTVGPAPQLVPDAFGAADGHAVVFRDFRRGPHDGRDRLRLFDAAGVPLPGASVELSRERAASTPPHVARSGAYTVTAWIEADGAVFVQRFRVDGTSPDPAPVFVTGSSWGAAVGATESAIVVASHGDASSFTSLREVDGTLVVTGQATASDARHVAGSRVDGVWFLDDLGGLTRFDDAGGLLGVSSTSIEPHPGRRLACLEARCLIIDDDGSSPGVVEIFADGTTSAPFASFDGPNATLATDGMRFLAAGASVVFVDAGRRLDVDAAWIQGTAVVDRLEADPWDVFVNGPLDSGFTLTRGAGATIAVYEDDAAARLRSRRLAPEIDGTTTTAGVGGEGGAGGGETGGAGGNGGDGGGGGSATIGSGGGGGHDASGGSGGNGGNGGNGATSGSSGGGGHGGSSTSTTSGASSSSAGGEGGASSAIGATGAGGFGGTAVGPGAPSSASAGGGGATSPDPDGGETIATSTSAGSAGAPATRTDGAAPGAGCSCQVPGPPDRSPLVAIGAVLALVWRRRRAA